MSSKPQISSAIAPGIGIGAVGAFLLLIAALATLFVLSPERAAGFVVRPAEQLAMMGLVLVLPILAHAADLLSRGAAVCAARRAGAAVLTGPAAIGGGRMILLLAAALLVAGSAIPVILWRLVSLPAGSA